MDGPTRSSRGGPCRAEGGQHGEGARVVCATCQVTLCPTHLASHTCGAASQPSPPPGPGRGRGGGRGSGGRGPGGRGRSRQGPGGGRSPLPASQSSSGVTGAAAVEAGGSQPGGTVEASPGEATTWRDKEPDTGREAADGPVVPRESLDPALDADPPPGFAPRPRGSRGGGVTTSDGVSTEGRVSLSNPTNNLGAASPLPPASPQVLSIQVTEGAESVSSEGIEGEETTGEGVPTEGSDSTSNFTNNLGAACPLPPASPQVFPGPVTEGAEPGSPGGIEGEETTGGGVSTEGGEDSTPNFTNNLGAACPLPPASPQVFSGPATEGAEPVTAPSPHQEEVKGSVLSRTLTESPRSNLATTLSTPPKTLVLVEAKAAAPKGPQQGGQGKAVTMWSPAGNWSKGCRSCDWSRGAKGQTDRSICWKEGRAKPATGLQGIPTISVR